MLFGDVSIERLLGGIIALLVGLTFHEFSHAAVADTLGDRRPRAMGRLTLNPIAHIDPVGALMLVVAGFGWAKPVMVNPSALRNGRTGLAFVAAAGPIANTVVAVAAAVIFRVLDILGFENLFVLNVLFTVVVLNLVLAVFNLLPIPPLDGYNVAIAFLPPRHAMSLRRYGQYGVFLLLALVFLSVMNSPIDPLGWIFGIARAVGLLLIGA
jgi:Zn-dependent protease